MSFLFIIGSNFLSGKYRFLPKHKDKQTNGLYGIIGGEHFFLKGQEKKKKIIYLFLFLFDCNCTHMCQGLTVKGTNCKRKDEPYCKDHQPVTSDLDLDLSICTLKIQSTCVRMDTLYSN